MALFGVEKYGPALTELMTPLPVCALGVGCENLEQKRLLTELDLEAAFAGRPIRDKAMAQCCLSGVWLLHGFLDQSHQISQDLPTPEGSYWHGIMHRREGDYSNAKYWFHRVGQHPIEVELSRQAAILQAEFSSLSEGCRRLLNGTPWHPDAMVDLCEAAAQGRVPDVEFIKSLAMLEWQLLFDHCYEHAI